LQAESQVLFWAKVASNLFLVLESKDSAELVADLNLLNRMVPGPKRNGWIGTFHCLQRVVKRSKWGVAAGTSLKSPPMHCNPAHSIDALELKDSAELVADLNLLNRRCLAQKGTDGSERMFVQKYEAVS